MPLPSRSLPPFPLLLAAALLPLACATGETEVGDTLAAAPAATADPACAVDANAVAEGVGPVRLDASAQAVATQCGGRDTSFTLAEGLVERGYVIPVGGSSVIALTNGDSIRRIIVRDSGVTTPAGIGVGSTVADVRRAYGDACALVGEGLIVLASNALPGVSFATSADYSQFAAGGSPQISALPDTAQVAMMWVHGVERPCAEVQNGNG